MDFDDSTNTARVEASADGERHECTIDFPVKGHLAKLTFDFGPGAGEVDFEWIGLYRRRQHGYELVKEWRYAR